MERKQENGVTLVAIVITIILLLIIATVSIKTIVDTRVFDYTRNSVNNAQNQLDTQKDMVQEVRNLYK